MGAGWILEKAERSGFVQACERRCVRGVAVFDFEVFARGVDDTDFARGDFLAVKGGVGEDFGA